MACSRDRLIGLVLAVFFACGTALAQSSSPPHDAGTNPAGGASAKSTGVAGTVRKEWDGISKLTRRQWDKLKVGWAREKLKWGDCNRQARAQKLSTTARWTAIGKCMIR